MNLIAVVLLSALFQQRHVDLSWTASTSPGATYNIYRGSGECSQSNPPATKLNSSPISGLTFSDTTMGLGTFCYGVKAFGGGLESPFSNLVKADVAPLPPSNLTISPTSATVETGQAIQFIASGPVEIWDLNPQLGTISTTGLYRAPVELQGNNKPVTVLAINGDQAASAAVTIRKSKSGGESWFRSLMHRIF